MSDLPEPRGPQATNPAKPLHRQIRPRDWVASDGRPSSQVFKTMPKDQGLLSLTDGDARDARQSFEFETSEVGLESCGVATVKLADFDSASVAVFHDPRNAEEDRVIDPHHMVANYRGLGRSKLDRLALLLVHAAKCELFQATVTGG